MLEKIQSLESWLQARILGQPQLVQRLLITLLSDGHLLVEGAPGLAKTKAINTLAQGLEADFQRIQFTPDLLPGDITGTEIFRPEHGDFHFQSGPIFHNLVLADEINRAPAKVQSALLEAMAERQVSVGKLSYPLDDVFMVMATQNPLEQEGTYPLPEAQLDRFLMHVEVDYPDTEAEKNILRLVRAEASQAAESISPVSKADILQARQMILQLEMSDSLEDYIVALVIATRQPEKYDQQLADWIECGVSPRGTLALDRCARAHAWLQGKDYVSPDDVQAVWFDVMRHRLICSFEAEAEGISKNHILQRILELVAIA